MALEGEESQKASSDRAGEVEGNNDANSGDRGGLPDTIKELFAGRLMNYIEVSFCFIFSCG